MMNKAEFEHLKLKISLSPDNSQYHQQLAEYYYLQNQYNEAKNHYFFAIQNGLNSKENYIFYANSAFRINTFGHALNGYLYAKEAGYKGVAIEENIAKCYFKINKFDEAGKIYNKLFLQDRAAKWGYWLFFCNYHLALFDEAIIAANEFFISTSESESEDNIYYIGEVFFYKAIAHFELQEFHEIVVCLRKSLELNYDRGLIYAKSRELIFSLGFQYVASENKDRYLIGAVDALKVLMNDIDEQIEEEQREAAIELKKSLNKRRSRDSVDKKRVKYAKKNESISKEVENPEVDESEVENDIMDVLVNY